MRPTGKARAEYINLDAFARIAEQEGKGAFIDEVQSGKAFQRIQRW